MPLVHPALPIAPSSIVRYDGSGPRNGGTSGQGQEGQRSLLGENKL